MGIALLAIRHYSQVRFNLADWSAQDPNIANLGLWTALKSYSYMASLYLKGQAGPQQGFLSTPSTQLHELTTLTCSNFCHLSFNNHQVLSRKTKPWYVVNPNKARFKNVIRIFAFVLRFIKKLQKKSKICQPSIAQKTSYPGILSDEGTTTSENYFLNKATSEVKEFVNKWISEHFISERWCSALQRKDASNRKDKCNVWNVNCNERFMFKHLLFTCELQEFTFSVQYSKRNSLAFRCSKTFRCRNSMEIRFETWIHNAG